MIFNVEKEHLLRHVDPQQGFYAKILNIEDLCSQPKYSRESVQKMIFIALRDDLGALKSRIYAKKPENLLIHAQPPWSADGAIYTHVYVFEVQPKYSRERVQTMC